MQIGVPKETAEGERRVALVPEVVRKLTRGAGEGPTAVEVLVERGAGAGALIPDEAFEEAGARLVDDAAGVRRPMWWSRLRRRRRGDRAVAVRTAC